MENTYCVYKHTSPSGKVYIGITRKTAIKRWANGKGYKLNPHFHNAILKYGWNQISHEILETGLSREKAMEEERRLIALYDATNPLFGYNMTFGGECGAKFTEEVKEKISVRLSAYYADPENKRKCAERQLGKKCSEETKRKMSESQKARITDEVREKLRTASAGRRYPNRKGHPQTKESKKRISDAKKGKHYGGKGRNPKPVLCVETGIVYESAIKAQEATGCGYGNIYRVCNMGRGTAGGYKWQYANEYNSGREIA